MKPQELQQAIVFTGHMIDAPDRKKPRFPPDAEGKARAMIAAEVNRLLRLTPGPALGIASAASGGDILFHEVCRDMGVSTRVLLPMPENLFVEHSVAPAKGDWTDRFTNLMQNHRGSNEVQVLRSTATLPKWTRDLPGSNVWKRTNAWLLEEASATGAANVTLVALWDYEAGLSGGTQDFIDTAKARGVVIGILNAQALLVK